MSSALVKTGLVILAGLSGFSLVANEVTVLAQEGIAPDGPAQLATLSTTNPGEGIAPDSPGAPTATTNPGEGIAPDGPAQMSSFFSSQSAASAASLSSAATLSTSSANAVTVTASAITVTASPVTVTGSPSTVTANPVTVTASSTAVGVSSSAVTATSSSIVTASVDTVTAPAVTVTSSTNAAAELYSLATQQAVVTQAPCVSACLQPAVIASAAGDCGRSLGLSIDNGCGCVSAPLMVMQALTNCASAACTGGAAGTMNPAAGPVAVSSLYLEYCVTAVGANVFESASASEASASVASSTSSTSSSEDSASQTMTSVPTMASSGMTMPGFTNGNSTFNAVNPTVTATTIITATATEAPSPTTSAGNSAGNNTGSKSDGGRSASGHLTMTVVACGLVLIMFKLLI